MMKTNQESQTFYCVNNKKNSNAHNSVHMVTEGVRLKRNGPIGKEKEKNEGVDYTPQLFISCGEKAKGREKEVKRLCA